MSIEDRDLDLESAKAAYMMYKAQAGLNFLLEMFGRDLAVQEGYTWLTQDGIESVKYYLMQKHNWLPAQVNSMSLEDLSFAVERERSSWTLNKKYRGIVD
ncbi:hypothetical protein L1077_21700 [Pseudoalteromonas luteoviolacea]|uniref:hypothetical protein n=1 Tax=Pseudoalteromonas luteoviolacea TaxID=43657 RepID=UPI001F306AF0|nr:hypothetical protein [Pseudoalteromonas luteoviolacea]MCF6442049.1 hypothetical protein [Pseudoalteromonas luteoviolacea]